MKPPIIVEIFVLAPGEKVWGIGRGRNISLIGILHPTIGTALGRKMIFGSGENSAAAWKLGMGLLDLISRGHIRRLRDIKKLNMLCLMEGKYTSNL